MRATRHDHKTSSQRAGHRTDGRREKALAAPLARTFSALACGRFHESRYRERKRTRQAEENPTAGVRELRTKHPRKRRATKISSETAKELQRAGTESQRVPTTCVRFANRDRSRTEGQRVPGTCFRRRSGDVSCLPMKFMSIQATVDGLAQRTRVVRRLGGFSQA